MYTIYYLTKRNKERTLTADSEAIALHLAWAMYLQTGKQVEIIERGDMPVYTIREAKFFDETRHVIDCLYKGKSFYLRNDEVLNTAIGILPAMRLVDNAHIV